MMLVPAAMLRHLGPSRARLLEKRCFYWTAFAAILCSLLFRGVAVGIREIDWLLTQQKCWSALLWLSFVRSGLVALLPPLATGLIIARQKRAYWPTFTVPLGVGLYWLGAWLFYARSVSDLPWFLGYGWLSIPMVIALAWLARRGCRLALRASYADPEAIAEANAAAKTGTVAASNSVSDEKTPQDGAEPVPVFAAAGPLGSRAKWAWMLFFIAILLVHAWCYMPFIIDDALISLRYAQRFLAGQGLTWTDGPPVEGYSNFLWVLANACLGFLGIDLITAARILGCSCMAAVIVAVVWYYSRRPQVDRLGLLVGLIFWSCSGPSAVWAIAGLEQPLIAIALVGAVLVYWSATEGDHQNWKKGAGLGMLLGVLCLTRPDGPLFTAALVAAYLLGAALKGHRWCWPFLLVFTLLPFACWAGQLGFRLVYYHDWLPNTAYAKVAFSWRHLDGGWDYVRKAYRSLLPISFMALACIVLGLAGRASRSRFLPIAITLAAWIGYLVFVGGDIFPAHRHFIPVIVLFLLAFIEGIPLLRQVLQTELAVPRPAIWIGAALLFALFVPAQFRDPDNHLAMIGRAEWDGQLFGLDLKQAFSEKQPLIAVTGAGCVPYWSQLPCLDMLGLNDHYLAHHPPTGIGEGLIGHELGNGDYVLRRKPDIILFDLGESKTPTFVTGQELSQNDEFVREYAQIVLLARRIPGSHEPPTSFIWFRRDSPKVGIRRSADRITIPALFFNTNPKTIALFHGRGLAIMVDSQRPAGICLDRVSADGWTAEVHGADPAAIRARLQPGKDSLGIELTTPSPTPVIVDEVVLRRGRESRRMALGPPAKGL